MTIEIDTQKRFIQFRKKYIGNQTEAAVICECSQKHISEIESGKTSVSLKIAYLLYKKLHMNMDWFFYGGKVAWTRKPEDKETLLSNVADLRGEIAVMSKYIEQMQKILNKVVKDVYANDNKS